MFLNVGDLSKSVSFLCVMFGTFSIAKSSNFMLDDVSIGRLIQHHLFPL